MDLIKPDFGIIFWQGVTFLIVLLILKKFAWKTILGTIEARETSIQHALASAKQAEKTLEQLEDKSKHILETAQLEREKILKEAMDSKKAIVEEAKVEAVEMGEQMITKARKAIETEKERAEMELNRHVITLTLQATKSLLKKELKTPQAQEELLKVLMKEQN